MASGQTLQLNYTDASTSTATGLTTTANVTYPLTFAGFDNLTLGGRAFANACKFKTPGSLAGQTSVSWIAQGFGTIQSETQDAQGVTVAGSRINLTTVVTAP